MQLFINNWASALTLPASASAVQLSVNPTAAALLVGLGSGDHYLLTLATVDVIGNETAWEIVRVTGKTAGVLDVVRGQEGTTALDLEDGAAISARLTRESMEALQVSGAAWGDITGPLAEQADLMAVLDAMQLALDTQFDLIEALTSRIEALEAGSPAVGDVLVDGAGNILINGDGDTLVING